MSAKTVIQLSDKYLLKFLVIRSFFETIYRVRSRRSYMDQVKAGFVSYQEVKEKAHERDK